MIAVLTVTNMLGLEYGKLDPEPVHRGQDRRPDRPDRAGPDARLERGRRREQLRRPLDPQSNAGHRRRADGGHGVRPVRRPCACRRPARCSRPTPGTTSPSSPARSGDPQRNLPLALALGAGLVITLYLLANVGLPRRAAARTTSRTPPSDRVGTAMMERIFPGVGRGRDGGRDHDLDVRLQQRPDPGRRPDLLRDGPRRPVLPPGRPAERRAGAGLGAGSAGRLGRRCSCCRAPSTRQKNTVRQPLRRPARLRHLGGAAVLHPDDPRPVPAALHPARRASGRTGRSAIPWCRPCTSSVRRPSSACCSSTVPRRPGRAWSSSCWGCRCTTPGTLEARLGRRRPDAESSARRLCWARCYATTLATATRASSRTSLTQRAGFYIVQEDHAIACILSSLSSPE